MTPDAASHTTRETLIAAARDELVEKGHASVSLRAVARRAGVSHAAPAHFFGDRAGMLTAVATEGFLALARLLDAAAAESSGDRRARIEALGRAYVDFGFAHPALIDLMFRRSELTPDDPALVEAQQASLGQLRAAVGDTGAAAGDTGAAAGEAGAAHAEGWSIISWAFVHGLVTLGREGVLAPIAGRDQDAAPDLARELVSLYATRFGAAEASIPRAT